MTDKIREAFEKWNNWHNFWNASPQDAFEAGYLAGRQSMLDELEQVGKFQQEYMGGPVIWYQVNLDQEGEPLYVIKDRK